MAQSMDIKKTLRLEELGNTYLDDGDRFVVSLIVGYRGDEDEDNPIGTPEQAVAAALDLTRDLGSSDTHWYVFDRRTGGMSLVEQGDAEPQTSWP